MSLKKYIENYAHEKDPSMAQEALDLLCSKVTDSNAAELFKSLQLYNLSDLEFCLMLNALSEKKLKLVLYHVEQALLRVLDPDCVEELIEARSNYLL